MSQFDLCRVCFTENKRMYNLNRTCYQEIYEKYTGAKLIHEERYNKLCYICHSLLQKFHKFMQMSVQAEKHLTETYNDGVELPSSVSLSYKAHSLTDDSLTFEPETEPQEIETLHSVLEDVAVKIESLDFDEECIEENYDNYDNIDIETKPIEIELKQPEIKISDVRVNLERLPLPKIKNKSVHCCQNCPRRFRTAALLRKHKHNCEAFLYLRTVRRQYSCQICDRHFNHKSMLLVHHRTHTGEKPFKCTLCDRAFNDKSNCRKHMKKHLNSYNCFMCERTFTERRALLKHAVDHIL